MAVTSFLKKAKEIQEQAQEKKSDRTHAPAAHDESNWLISYADMMTLLCGFFIMLFSMSTLDQPKYEQAKQSLAKQFHGEYTKPGKDLGEFASNILQEAGVEKKASVKSDASGVSITFESTIFFDTLSAEVKPAGREILTKLISRLGEKEKKNGKHYHVIVEGHTDSRPVLSGTFASNWELSGARASRVVRMFVDQGFAANHLLAIGYGDTRPRFPSRTPAGQWDEAALAKNRRVVIRILEPEVDSVPLFAPVKALTIPSSVQPAAAAPAAVAPQPTPSTSEKIAEAKRSADLIAGKIPSP
jgi:chemotaxis protein MotB